MTSPGEAANQTALLRYWCSVLILTVRLTEQHVPVHASPSRWKHVVLAKNTNASSLHFAAVCGQGAEEQSCCSAARSRGSQREKIRGKALQHECTARRRWRVSRSVPG